MALRPQGRELRRRDPGRALRQTASSSGWGDWRATSGTPPSGTTVTRSVDFSYRRGTSDVATPSRSQRFSSRIRTSSGAVENVTMTCSIRFSPTIRSRSQLARGQGGRSRRSVKRVLVEEPDRSQPDLGMLSESLRNQAPDVARTDDQRALTGVTASPGAALGPMSQIRPAITNAVAKSQGLMVSTAADDASVASPRSATVIAAR